MRTLQVKIKSLKELYIWCLLISTRLNVIFYWLPRQMQVYSQTYLLYHRLLWKRVSEEWNHSSEKLVLIWLISMIRVLSCTRRATQIRISDLTLWRIGRRVLSLLNGCLNMFIPITSAWTPQTNAHPIQMIGAPRQQRCWIPTLCVNVPNHGPALLSGSLPLMH